MNVGCFFVSALILAVPAAADNDLFSIIEGKILESAFASGKSQIFAAKLTPECRNVALTNLENVKAGAMRCNGSSEILSEVGMILDQALNSTSDFVADLNTLFNEVPSCLENHDWYNFIGIFICFASQVKPVIDASNHINNFTNYYMDTISMIKELIDCLHANKSAVEKSVKSIVKTASLCSSRNGYHAI
ncbi:hypothetical protein GE061_010417 [Apolygus lucorum]|uniref:Protein TsetseEP domain-containing protein n=1 Tax=Apolygus lucorum TaxID=248454 RepID=A0A8S9Y505_APOLU|nr:hypothetical protein GE061_010417 [Apolygus lucorum]